MLPYLKNNYGNASSTHHFGLETKKAVENSREMTSSLLNCEAKEIVFTSTYRLDNFWCAPKNGQARKRTLFNASWRVLATGLFRRRLFHKISQRQ